MAILIKKHIPFKQLPLNTGLQAVAIRVKMPQETSIVSLYLHPNLVITEQDIQSILNQIPAPVMLDAGDYNASN